MTAPDHAAAVREAREALMQAVVDGINAAVTRGATSARLESLESSAVDALIAAVRRATVAECEAAVKHKARLTEITWAGASRMRTSDALAAVRAVGEGT